MWDLVNLLLLKIHSKIDSYFLGLLHYFLGLEVKQSLDGTFVSQEKYAADLLRRFNMLGCNIASTPMNVNEKLISDDGTGVANAWCFRSIVDGLNYLSHTRPDIVFSVSVISRFMHTPTMHHLGPVKRILRYVAGTVDHGIWYSKVSDFKLFGFTDSDWAGCLDDRKSISEYVFSLGSGAISWSSKKQEIMALLSFEVEYVAATASACQAIWLRRLLADMFQEQAAATNIFCDNKSSITMTKNPSFHRRTKHIDIWYLFIRHLVSSRSIKLEYCSNKSTSSWQARIFQITYGSDQL